MTSLLGWVKCNNGLSDPSEFGIEDQNSRPLSLLPNMTSLTFVAVTVDKVSK